MRKRLSGSICPVVGLVVGVIVGGTLNLGAAAGAGAASGLGVGICPTVIAARAEGLRNSEEAERVLTRSATDMAATADASDGGIVGSAGDPLAGRQAAGTGSGPRGAIRTLNPRIDA